MARRSKGFQGCLVPLLLIIMVVSGRSAKPGASAQQGDAEKNTDVETGSSKAETRVVQDEYGEVTIPVHPRWIAGVYVEDYLKALDIKPVVQWYHPTWGVQDYLNLDVPKFDITGALRLSCSTIRI